MENVKAHFTIEARNIDNKLTGEGGHLFLVSITGISSDNIELCVVDKENGQYDVQYIPPAPGTYVIGITLDGISISGSPFTVNILKFKTAPLPHWFYLEKQTWVPYEDAISDQIENIYFDLLSFQNGIGCTCVTHNGVHIYIDYKKMKEKGKKKKEILRGTWFYRDDEDKSWIPFSKDVATKLEDAYQNNEFERVEVSFQPPRYVTQEGPDTFRQYRKTKNANPLGRLVQRGYKNLKFDDLPRHLLES